MDGRVRRVLTSDTDPLCAPSDETCDPRQDVITDAKGMVQPVDEDVVVDGVEGSGQI